MATLIDLHTHTSHSSGCAHMTAEQLIEAAIEAGLDGVAVTEHLVPDGAQVAQEIGRRKYGFPVFCGVEANATIFGDVLVFGCCRGFAHQTPWEDLRRVVKQAGGVVIAAHPFRHWDGLALWSYLEEQGLALSPDLAEADFVQGLTAIEVENGGIRPDENEKAVALARVLGLPGAGGSDAHVPQDVGRAATLFSDSIHTDDDLVEALKRGSYRAVTRWQI
jgi:predicted metal-dependent phosphoesterase TrpH